MSDAQYKEGGGDTLPPYQEDYFQRIVNVSWVKGAICIACDIYGNIFYGDLQNEKSQKWTVNPDIPFLDKANNAVAGAAYAYINKKAVFVLAGTGNMYGDFRVDDTVSTMVYTSNDGKTWRRTYFNPEYDNPSLVVGDGDIYSEWEYMTAVVWDDQAGAFYFSTQGIRVVAGAGFEEELRLYRSLDGNSWSQVSTTGWINVNVGGQPDSAEPIYPHCRKPQNRNQIPDGLQGYDKKSGIFMMPKDLRTVIPSEITFANYPPAAQVSVDPKTGTASNISVPGSCYCVGGTNGIWVAGGGGGGYGPPAMLVTSFDGGKIWKDSGAPLPANSWVTTLITAPSNQVKKTK